MLKDTKHIICRTSPRIKMTRPGSALRSEDSMVRSGDLSWSYVREICDAPTSCIKKEKRSKMTNVGVIQRGKHHSVLKFRAYVGQLNQMTLLKAV